MRRSLALGFALLVCFALRASAEAQDSGRSHLHVFELAAGGHAGASLGDVCERDGDVIGCGGGFAFAGVQAAPRLRLGELYSIGTFLSASWGRIDDARSVAIWLAELEGRYHPLGSAGLDPSIGVGVGWVAIETSVPADNRPAREFADGAPSVSVRAALDVALDPAVQIGPELRLFSALFPASVETFPDEEISYGRQLGAALLFNLTLLLGAAGS